MKVLLGADDFKVVDDLTYEQAINALKQTETHCTSDKLIYSIQLKKGKWGLYARIVEYTSDFLKNPEKYIIEI